MSFTTDLADLVSAQFERFVTLNPHQLSGHAENLEFWLSQTRHALSVIDGYHPRFQKLKAAQSSYVHAHRTVEFLKREPSLCFTPDPPVRLPDEVLRATRQRLVDATWRLLVRFHNAGFLDRAQVIAACDDIGIGWDGAELKAVPTTKPAGQEP